MQTEYDTHQAAIEAAFAYLRSRNAIHKLANPSPVWGRLGACFWLPKERSCLAVRPKPDLALVPTPTVRFRRSWPPCPPLRCQEPLDNSLLARLAGWFRRNLI